MITRPRPAARPAGKAQKHAQGHESCVKQGRPDGDSTRAARGAGPARPLPAAAAATPATISAFPSGRRRKERRATPTTASVPIDIRQDRKQPGGEEGKVILRCRDPVRGEHTVHRHGE